ncbi:MAG: glycosyltransferase family 4 protein [Syntrophales bacterium]|nr:glycosyltransferase family 4 protein [Syntrophales bacterium]MCK9527545.1 glycosyltransferase family 4 protein [Syntrophales bacterium]MDX9922602.1 glycosyltransferase family 4 protein [Syntrophales bacterium]
MKIAVLIKNFVLSGGAERYAVEVARRLRDRGHDIDLYARNVDTSLTAGMTHVQVPDRHTYRTVANSLSYARETARLLEGRNYDAIHSHERAYSQDVLTVHTFCYRSGFTGGTAFLKRLFTLYLSPRSRLYEWLEKKQMASPRLVAVSEVIRHDIQARYGRTEGVRVITPGVDFTWFHPDGIAALRSREKRGPSTGELTVLFVGGEFRRKGLDKLIPAIGEGMKLIVVGRGERLDYHRRLAISCGTGSRVEFVGHVDDDVRGYYAGADVVVLPSRREAFGMSILEGMACGLPVIASPVAGVAGLINDGENGFLAGETDELKAALNLLRDETLRKKMGDRARKTAESCSWDRITDSYEEVFLGLSGSRGAQNR